MNHKEVSKMNRACVITIILQGLALVGCALQNDIMVIVGSLGMLLPLPYIGYWAKKAADIDRIYYGQICEQCKDYIANCICMAEIDGAWNDAFDVS